MADPIPHEMPIGTCSCGAVYACDVTGHNLGTAMIEALAFGCKGDWDMALDLMPEKDYLEKEVDHYDLKAHLIVNGGIYEGRRIGGTLYFIRLHKDWEKRIVEGTRQQPTVTAPSFQQTPEPIKGKSTITKEKVENLVKEYDLAPLLHLAERDKKIIRNIQRLIYSGDKLIRWRAADALGKVSGTIAKRDPAIISRLLQGLFSSLADTAASSWGCLDAIGDIISNSPDLYADYTLRLYPFTKDKSLLSDVLRALVKISRAKPDMIRRNGAYFVSLLPHPEVEVRGYAAAILGNLGATEAKADLENLLRDSEIIETYQDGGLIKKTIGELAAEALMKL
ncbi:MAG: PBS lyase [Pseudomonadota bacterium]